MNIRKFLRANSLFSALYYAFHIDELSVIFGTRSYMKRVNSALEKFGTHSGLCEHYPIGGGNLQIINDIKRSYLQCKASPDEYFLLDLGNADADKRKSFITDKFMYKTLGKLVGREKHDNEIEDKWGFYCLAKKYFNREVVRVTDEQDYKHFSEMDIHVKHLICKPNDKALALAFLWLMSKMR